MKSSVLVAWGILACGNLFAQGTVDFANDATTTVTNSLTADRVAAGTSWLTALYYLPDTNGPAPTSSNFDALGSTLGAAAAFGPPGFFNGGTRTTPGTTPPGGFAYFQVRTWETVYGTSYAAAVGNRNLLNGRHALAGTSMILKIQTGTSTPTSLTSAGLQSYKLFLANSNVIRVVVNRNDSGSGSLRQAIQDASATEFDTIAFAPGVTGRITVTNGELLLTKPLTISGPGAGALAISGNNAHRVFHVTNSATVSISGLTICDGRLVGTNGPVGLNGENVRGAGILNEATLTLTGCVISNNSVIGGQGGPTNQFGNAGNGGNGNGGGIQSSGTLTIKQCTVVSNAAIGGLGGPSAFSGSGGQGWGGGLYLDNSGSPAVLVDCTITSNNATAGSGSAGPGGGLGAGIYSANLLRLTNCTVANNTASGSSFDSGGGINDNGGLILRSCTLSGNQADFGGGLKTSGADVGNTIIAGNIAGSGPDCSGTIASSDYNLVQITNGCTFTGTTTHNIIGQNPLLGPLQNNGGVTLTMSLLAGSPAVDKGKGFSLMTDQRGGIRPFDKSSITNSAGGDGSDIGAFEVGSYFLLTDVRRAGNDIRVGFTTDAGNTYALQRRDDVVSGVWTNLMTNISGTGATVTVTNSGAAGLLRGYYRGQSVP